MAISVTLTVLTGPHRMQTFGFREGSKCLIGRSCECQVNLSGSNRDMLISRRHCLLEIDAPTVFAIDLGSRNGTFVNGRRIAPQQDDPPGQEPDAGRRPLEDGDILTVGGTSLRISILPVDETVQSSKPTRSVVGEDSAFSCCI